MKRKSLWQITWFHAVCICYTQNDKDLSSKYRPIVNIRGPFLSKELGDSKTKNFEVEISWKNSAENSVTDEFWNMNAASVKPEPNQAKTEVGFS